MYCFASDSFVCSFVRFWVVGRLKKRPFFQKQKTIYVVVCVNVCVDVRAFGVFPMILCAFKADIVCIRPTSI